MLVFLHNVPGTFKKYDSRIFIDVIADLFHPFYSLKVTLERMFQGLTVKEVKATSLSLTRDSDTLLDANSPISVNPMEVDAYKIKFH